MASDTGHCRAALAFVWEIMKEKVKFTAGWVDSGRWRGQTREELGARVNKTKIRYMKFTSSLLEVTGESACLIPGEGKLEDSGALSFEI